MWVFFTTILLGPYIYFCVAMWYSNQEYGLWSQDAWIQIPALLLPSCVILGTSLHFSVTISSFVKWEWSSYHLREWLWKLKKLIFLKCLKIIILPFLHLCEFEISQGCLSELFLDVLLILFYSCAVKSKCVKQLFRVNHSLPPHTISGYQKLCLYRQEKSTILGWVFLSVLLLETAYHCYFWLLVNSQRLKHWRRINNLLWTLRPLDNKNYSDSEQTLWST